MCNNSDCGFRVCAGYEVLVCPYCMVPFTDEDIVNEEKLKLVIEHLARVLEIDGVLNGLPATGPEIVAAAEAYVAHKKALQQTQPVICPHFDTWTIIGKDNEVQYKIPVCLCRGKQQSGA